jgi:methylphosphotriester-DNA--protein-cysteine methyltransferase
MREQANGAGPPGAAPDELREHIISDARALIAQEQQKVDRLSAELAEAKRSLAQAHKVLEVMVMEPAQPKAAKPVQPPEWQVSERLVAKALEAIRLETEPITMTELRQKIGMASASIKQVMQILREREQVRVTGRARGGGTLYLPMPELTLNRDHPLVVDEQAAHSGA